MSSAATQALAGVRALSPFRQHFVAPATDDPATDYRAILHAKPLFTSIRDESLRTHRQPGHVEIVRDPKTGEWVKHVYDAQVAG